jgi:peptidoglycan/LPS O-acetylase OafA/YrhL
MNDFTIFTRIDSIALGCLFALYKDKIIEILSKRWGLIFWCSIIGLFLLNPTRTLFSRFHAYHLDFIFIPLGTTFGSIANLFIGLIMMYSVFGPQKLWFKLLNTKLLNYIGILSYSIYLWQQFFMFNSQISKKSVWITDFPQNIFFMILAALFSYYVIEKPFLRLKSKFP